MNEALSSVLVQVNKNIKEVDMLKMHFAVSEQKADKDNF